MELREEELGSGALCAEHEHLVQAVWCPGLHYLAGHGGRLFCRQSRQL